MEEQKKNNEEKQLSYEELSKAANSLFNENKALKQKLQEAYETLNSVSRLNYLLKIVEINQKNSVFDGDFIIGCIAEIEKAMTIPQEEEEESKEN